MDRKYILLAAIVIALGIGMLFMPSRHPSNQLQPDVLLAAIDDPSRFLSTDDITDRLVKKDPALLLIDVRPKAEFTAFSIPGAVNIPLDSLLSAPAQDIINQKEMDKVFCSNSDLIADQAWIITKRLNLSRIYIMKGGINQWFANIVKAEKPAETAPSEALQLYNFRMAACQFFFGSKQTPAPAQSTEKKSADIVRKPTTGKSGGGC